MAGITPAYAGNTYVNDRAIVNDRDHPRLRGEHGLVCLRIWILCKSPPPTRGTRKRPSGVVLGIGITPAYAGNTFFRKAYKGAFWDHPRLRGEHLNQSQYQNNRQGSPPPTRGTPSPCPFITLPFRITPAYAGNTNWFSILNHSFEDHPRLRGEHLQVTAFGKLAEGSPPPTRGTHYQGH